MEDFYGREKKYTLRTIPYQFFKSTIVPERLFADQQGSIVLIVANMLIETENLTETVKFRDSMSVRVYYKKTGDKILLFEKNLNKRLACGGGPNL